MRILNQRDLGISDTTLRRKGNRGGENYEFDIIAHNTTEIVIVEVKTPLRVKDVKKFLDKMAKAKRWMPEYKDYRVLGAVAFQQDADVMFGLADCVNVKGRNPGFRDFF